MLWTRIKRTSETPNFALLDINVQFQNLIAIGEILFENKKITDYSIFEGCSMVHNHADVALSVDSTLKQVRIGTDVIYQCPVSRSFLFVFSGSVTIPAATTFDFVRYIDPSGTVLFDTDSVAQTSNLPFRNAGIALTTATAVFLRWFILEY